MVFVDDGELSMRTTGSESQMMLPLASPQRRLQAGRRRTRRPFLTPAEAPLPSEVEAKTYELVMAPNTGSLRLFRLVKVGQQLDLLGLIHVSF